MEFLQDLEGDPTLNVQKLGLLELCVYCMLRFMIMLLSVKVPLLSVPDILSKHILKCNKWNQLRLEAFLHLENISNPHAPPNTRKCQVPDRM